MTATATEKPSLSMAQQIARLDESERDAILSEYSSKELDALWHDWLFWARPEQTPPDDDHWDIFFLLGGRGSGKTRPSAELIHQWATAMPGSYYALIGETAAECRDTMAEGESGLIPTMKPWNVCEYEPSKRRITWQNGSWGTFFSGDAPEQLRGPNCHGAWVDELAKFRYVKATWDNLEMINRAGDHPRIVVSTTPKPIPLIKELIADSRTVLRRYSTYANEENLAPSFIRRILERYEGTRIGQQELHAEILDDNPDALWSRDLLEECRVEGLHGPVKACIGVDPPGGLITECGIVGSVLVMDGRSYVVADRSVAGKPEKWSAAVWGLATFIYETYGVAPRITAEKNHGGEMVRSTLEASRPAGAMFPLDLVTASVGKAARAEPVEMLYEQGRYAHLGTYPQLEAEMCQWNPLDEKEPSPNRLDALVWSAYGLGVVGGKRKMVQVYGD